MKKILLVDCFDTIIYRKVPAEQIKVLWANELSAKLIPLKSEEIYRLVKAVENEFVSKKIEWNITLMCEKMNEYINIYNLSFNMVMDFVSKAVELYHKVEMQNQYLNNKMVKLLKQQKALNKKIYIVSDFYCGKEALKMYFENLGISYLIEDYFVSCDVDKTKANGNIYNLVLNLIGAKISDVTMIGDNKISDYKNPKQLGINCKRVFPRKLKQKQINSVNKIKITESIKKIYKTNRGFSNYAFPLYNFTKKLVEKLSKSKVENVFFLSREGQFLKKIFDHYCNSFNVNIRSHYLEMSRNSIMISALKDVQSESFNSLLSETGSISIFKFLKSLQFNDDDINAIQAELGFGFNEEIVDIKKSKSFEQLFSNDRFIEIYDSKRKQQRKLFKKYLDKFNVNYKDNGIHLVDVGWKGTMQDLLYAFFDGNVDINGYYLGLTSARNISNKNKKFGLLYSCVPFSPTIVEKKHLYQIYNYEQVLRASHNRVIGYIEKDGEVVSLYDQSIDDKTFYELNVKTIQEKIFDKFSKLCDLKEDIDEEVVSSLYLKMQLSINYKDYCWLHDCLNNHFDSFARSEYAFNLSGKLIHYLKHKLKNLKFFVKLLLNRI